MSVHHRGSGVDSSASPPPGPARDWEDAAREAPYWSIARCTDVSPTAVQEFFRSGEEVVEGLLARAGALGLPEEHELALDFGCGVGRLSRALASIFENVVGLDLAPGMIAEAQRLNRVYAHCSFAVTNAEDLAGYAASSFDLVLSHLVLQHMSSKEAIRWHIRQFVRLVRPNGLVIFQLPSDAPWWFYLQPRRRLYHILRASGFSARVLFRLRLSPIRMHTMSRDSAEHEVRAAGGRVLFRKVESWPFGVTSVTYFVSATADPQAR